MGGILPNLLIGVVHGALFIKVYFSFYISLIKSKWPYTHLGKIELIKQNRINQLLAIIGTKFTYRQFSFVFDLDSKFEIHPDNFFFIFQ